MESESTHRGRRSVSQRRVPGWASVLAVAALVLLVAACGGKSLVLEDYANHAQGFAFTYDSGRLEPLNDADAKGDFSFRFAGTGATSRMSEAFVASVLERDPKVNEDPTFGATVRVFHAAQAISLPSLGSLRATGGLLFWRKPGDLGPDSAMISPHTRRTVTATTLNGRPAFRLSLRWSKYRSMQYWVIDGDRLYTLETWATVGAWSASAPTFDALVKSFRIRTALTSGVAGQVLCSGGPSPGDWPLANVKVEVHAGSLSAPIVAMVKADAKGRFRIALVPGHYTLIMHKYDDHYRSATPVAVSAGVFSTVRVMNGVR